MTTSHGLTTTRVYEPQRDVLEQVTHQFDTDVISQYEYVSDELRRRTSLTTSGLAFESPELNPLAELTETYTTNALNQYTNIQSSVSSDQLTYDLDGNLTNDETFHYAYDAENRLVSVTPLNPQNSDQKTEYVYDYMSRRVQKTVSVYDTGAWALETERSFIYDGWNLIKEQTTEGGNTTTDYYVWGLDLSGTLQGAGGIGDLLAKTNNLTSKTVLYTVDANGNVSQLVDSSTGTIAAHYEYDPFGKLLVATGSEAENNVFRFSTKYVDVEVGLSYYGYRYYSMELGRWLTRDPIGEDGGINLYGYVNNNPLNFKDALGLSSFWPMVNFNNGNNPLNKEIQAIQKKIDEVNSLLSSEKGGAYTGMESHVLLGSGLTWLTCCDSKTNQLRKITFRKKCFGLAIGFGAFVGASPNFDCNYENYEGWFFETGITIPVGGFGFDVGIQSSEGEIPFLGIPSPIQPSGVYEFEWGPAIGLPEIMIKATACYYTMIDWEEIGCCLK